MRVISAMHFSMNVLAFDYKIKENRVLLKLIALFAVPALIGQNDKLLTFDRDRSQSKLHSKLNQQNAQTIFIAIFCHQRKIFFRDC